MVEAKDKKSLHLQHLEKLTFRERRALCQYEIDKITVKRSATNPFFNSKYSTLDDLYNVIQGPLEKQGLFHVFKFCSTQNGNILKLQILDRVSDEFEESCLTIPESVMEIAQNFGSFTTYQKRYMISANFGISCPETDEDGNIQVPQKNPSRKPSESSPKKDNQSTSSGGEDSQSSDREYWFKEPYLTKFQTACESRDIGVGQLWDHIFDNYKSKRGKLANLDDIKFLTATDKDRLMGDIEMGLKKVEEANPQVELTEADLEEDKADDIPF
tara:strand:+ start:4742 stop:5554 length:813 start_codon:yes stop_codon:yes gene_type:complete